MSKSPDFYARLEQAIHQHNSLLGLRLAPRPENLPDRHRTKSHTYPADLLAWMHAIIDDTADLVCAYILDYAQFEALAIPGLELLQKTLAHIPLAIPKILDAQRSATGASASALARLDAQIWGVDAVTVNAYSGKDILKTYSHDKRIIPFVICNTGQQNASELQMLEISDWQSLDREPNQPLYIHMARTALRWESQAGLVVSATAQATLSAIRHSFPDQWFLVTNCAQALNASVLTDALRSDQLGGIFDEGCEVGASTDYRRAATRWAKQLNEQRECLKAA